MAKCLPIIYFFSTDFASVGELVSQHIDVLGPMPPSWWMHWRERGQFFDDDGRPKEARYNRRGFEEGVQKYRRKRGCESDREEAAAIIDPMRRMFVFQLEERPTTQEVLQSDWRVKWALPGLERSSQME
ncbi:kinase domain protein [Penicillium chrysogenum]|uniref:kinase domain protein n=1 Tax=Penicillium chrysogenum TaxID=5076 RepID=UPI0024DF134C|nr:kinase domain protein [Penicillium chrysogenum]KAJ5228004.1 kinase domain protein [Penicillium chrysogenum]KAJ6167508.1 kinase domain protein [Penicillium chrysogenum]